MFPPCKFHSGKDLSLLCTDVECPNFLQLLCDKPNCYQLNSHLHQQSYTSITQLLHDAYEKSQETTQNSLLDSQIAKLNNIQNEFKELSQKCLQISEGAQSFKEIILNGRQFQGIGKIVNDIADFVSMLGKTYDQQNEYYNSTITQDKLQKKFDKLKYSFEINELGKLSLKSKQQELKNLTFKYINEMEYSIYCLKNDFQKPLQHIIDVNMFDVVHKKSDSIQVQSQNNSNNNSQNGSKGTIKQNISLGNQTNNVNINNYMNSPGQMISQNEILQFQNNVNVETRDSFDSGYKTFYFQARLGEKKLGNQQSSQLCGVCDQPTLKLTARKCNWFCDLCKGRYSRFTQSMYCSCQTSGYDICQTCHDFGPYYWDIKNGLEQNKQNASKYIDGNGFKTFKAEVDFDKDSFKIYEIIDKDLLISQEETTYIDKSNIYNNNNSDNNQQSDKSYKLVFQCSESIQGIQWKLVLKWKESDMEIKIIG